MLNIEPNQSGISLIEVLISLLIISGGILAATGFQGTLLENASHSKQRSEATKYAISQIEQLRAEKACIIPVPAPAPPDPVPNTTGYCSATFANPTIADKSACSLTITGTDCYTDTATTKLPGSGTNYDRKWKITDLVVLPTPAGAPIYQKKLEVLVYWTDKKGNTQTSEITTILAATR